MGLVLAFVRSGYLNVSVGAIYNIGFNGYDWFRTSLNMNIAYSSRFDQDDVISSNASHQRLYAFPLRCLYLGSV